MDTQLKANLEKAIEKWVNTNCEDSNWPFDIFFYDGQVADMANAAAMIFDANCKGQRFAENPNEPTPLG